MRTWLITLGIVLVVAELLWPLFQKIGLGRLPGDFVIERGNVRLYLPLGTSILISLVLSLLFWLLNR
jgi:prepilin signal peptidase PulO-like enzyme (type II secretory pathway)